MPLPKQWGKYLSNPKNKANLAKFLSEFWCDNAPHHLADGQQLILGGGFADGNLARMITNTAVSELSSLSCCHEEADTRMLFHAANVASMCPRIVIWSPDTDVAVLCVYHFAKLNEVGASELWLHTGVKDKTRYIPIHDISSSLGSALTGVLPGFHALTGCDLTSCFSGIGKVKPGGESQCLQSHFLIRV